MTVKILTFNLLRTRPEEVQSRMELELNALQPTGKVSWQVLNIGPTLWCFISVEQG
jgi:hypothetical protein